MQAKISIVQIGDAHFDELNSSAGGADLKDVGDPGGIGRASLRPRSDAVAEALSSAISVAQHPLIAICGDLSSRGRRDIFEEAIHFLGGVVNAPSRGNLDMSSVHIVPGNHDVAWRSDMPFVDLGVERFRVLSDVVEKERRLGAVLTTSIRHTHVHGETTGGLEVLSVNSCRAVGSPRPTPGRAEPVLDALGASGVDIEGLVEPAIAAICGDVKMAHELLDIPFFHPDDLSTLVKELNPRHTAGLPVVVAHHGFLPQGIPRIAPYTEMVNGGAVREQLLGLDRPVLYLHGHIHRDTVEVLQRGPQYRRGGPVVVVSAPTLSEGFNVLDVSFDTQSDTPLGVVITRYRLDEATGAIRPNTDLERIPMVTRRRVSSESREIIAYLNETRACRGHEIVSGIPSMTPGEVETLVMRGVWEGLISLNGPARERPFTEQEFVF